jgi:hypothetical protein
VTYLVTQPGAVQQLVFGPDANHLVALSSGPPLSTSDRQIRDQVRLRCFERGSKWQQAHGRFVEQGTSAHRVEMPWIFPAICSSHEMGLCTESGTLQLLGLPRMLPVGEVTLPEFAPTTAFLLPMPAVGDNRVMLIAFDGHEMRLYPSIDPLVEGELPHERGFTSLAFPTLRCWHLGGGHFEFVGLGQGNNVGWLRLKIEGKRAVHHVFQRLKGEFLTAALVRGGIAVAVDRTSIVHVRFSADRVMETARLPISFPRATACFVCQRTQELVIVNADGELVRGRWLP